MKAIGISVF